MEIWKDIDGYEGLYQVSNEGRVKSLARNGIVAYGNRLKDRILKPYTQIYKSYRLCKDGKANKEMEHILVAKAFIPNPENKPCVDHINDIPTDNRVENLRWVTHQENNEKEHHRLMLSKANTGKKATEETLKKISESRKGKFVRENSPTAKKIKVVDINSGEEEIFECITTAAKLYNVHPGCITRAKSNGKPYHNKLWIDCA